MQILTIADVLANRGGLELLQFELCSQLADRGHTLRVLHRAGGDLEPAWRRFATEVRRVPAVALDKKGRRPPVGFVAALPRTVTMQADVVYAHYYEHLELAWLAGRAGRRPVVAHLHLRGPASLGRFGRRLVRAADHYVAISAAVADGWAAAGVPRSRITVVHNGVDTDRFRPVSVERRLDLRARRGLPPDAFVVVYAGRLIAHKGAQVLLSAFEQVWSRFPAAVLLLAGSGPTPDALPCGARHVGLLTRDETALLVQLADVVAVPTTEFDGFPLIVAEALACGVPVVASSVGGIPEQLTGWLAEWLVPPSRPELLAERIGSLADWRSREPELADRCRAHAVVAFSRTRMVDAVEGVLRRAVAAQR